MMIVVTSLRDEPDWRLSRMERWFRSGKNQVGSALLALRGLAPVRRGQLALMRLTRPWPLQPVPMSP